MINRYLKEDYDYTQKLKQLGKKIVESEKLDEEQRKKFFEEDDLSDAENEEEDEFEDEMEIKEAQKMINATKEEKHSYFKS